MGAIWLFIGLANLISWLIWLPLVAASLGWIEAQPSPYLHLLGGVGPLIAAFIVMGVYGGRPGVRGLAQRAGLWRVPVRWHVVAWLGPVALYVIGLFLVRAVWGEWPDVTRFGQTEEFPELPILVYWAANIVFYGWGEETGWRGFLLPKLQDRMGALKATLLVTPIWIVWHAPLFFFIDGYTGWGIGEITGWTFSMLTGALLMTWLFNSAAGSILVVAVFHGTIDIVMNTPSPGDMAFVLGMLITFWGLWVLVRKDWTNLSDMPRQQLDWDDPEDMWKPA